MQLDALTPALSDLIAACLAALRHQRRAQPYLALLRAVCTIVPQSKQLAGHEACMEHLVRSQLVPEMLHLLLAIVDAAECDRALREEALELCLVQPVNLRVRTPCCACALWAWLSRVPTCAVVMHCVVPGIASRFVTCFVMTKRKQRKHESIPLKHLVTS